MPAAALAAWVSGRQTPSCTLCARKLRAWGVGTCQATGVPGYLRGATTFGRLLERPLSFWNAPSASEERVPAHGTSWLIPAFPHLPLVTRARGPFCSQLALSV